MHHTSRGWQNIIHVCGVINSVLTVFGAVLIGSQNYGVGVAMMVVGAVVLRITSEVDYHKWRELIKEQR